MVRFNVANNPFIAKKQREELIQKIDEFFAQGNEVKQLGNQMKPTAINFVINPQKHFEGEKLPPSFKR